MLRRVTHEDAEYFAERGRRERLAASQATDPKLSAMHMELAERYEALAEAFAGLDRTRMGQA